MTQTVGQTLAIGSLAVFFLMFILWLIYLKGHNAGIVDVGWGLGFVLLIWIYFYYGPGLPFRKFLIASIVTLWGLRLSLFIRHRLAQEG